MKLSELEAKFRQDSGDQAQPYVFSSAYVRILINEAQREACKRMDLIREADDAGMCELAVDPGDTSLEFSELWVRITGAWWQGEDGQRRQLEIVTDRRVLDRRSGSWRTTMQEIPETLLIEQRKGRFGCVPRTAGSLILEGFRFPLEDMSRSDDTPEVDPVHQGELVRWALNLAFTGSDTEMRDLKRAEREAASFERYFGASRTAGLWQPSEDAPQFNIPQW